MPHNTVVQMDGQSVRTRYTSFPDLHSHVLNLESIRQDGAHLPTQWPMPVQDVAPDILTRAWAHLLHCHTGENEPVFRVDGKTVRCDVANGPLVNVAVEENPSVMDMRTGIFTQEVSLSPVIVDLT